MTGAALETLWAKVEAQRERVPAMYGAVDFRAVPERFTAAPGDDTALSGKYARDRDALLADPDRVEFIRAYTMIGDATADAYAGLMREHGFRALVDMLTSACEADVIALVLNADAQWSPFSPGFTVPMNRPTIGLVTKADLADPQRISLIGEWLRQAGARQIFITSALNNLGLDAVLNFLNSKEPL